VVESIQERPLGYIFLLNKQVKQSASSHFFPRRTAARCASGALPDHTKKEFAAGATISGLVIGNISPEEF